MFNIAIVDDNKQIRKYTKEIIDQTLFSLDIGYHILQFESSEHFLNSNCEQLLHLLILDIELPNMSGIELAKKVSQRTDNIVIFFLTSFDGYMKNAFGLNVHRYILKSECKNILPKELIEIVRLFTEKTTKNFKTPNGHIHLVLDTILYIESIERNPYINLIDGEKIKLSSSTLRSILHELDDDRFLHINNHTIINMKYIRKFSNKIISLEHLTKEFEISRRKSKEIFRLYHEYLMKGDLL